MCCFSSPHVESVADTFIFGRDGKRELQYVVYQMTLKTPEETAMILPLPVPRRTTEESVRFINLEQKAGFFDNLEDGFRQRAVVGAIGGFGGSGGTGATLPKLKVIDVGSFEASYVPAIQDFARLDERFRLPSKTWDQLPRYTNYGFAVFKLKKGHQQIHPMAFEFPRLDRTKLFFPTVHIHDGKVHDTADFDHVLYAQFGPYHDPYSHMDWTESERPASAFMGKSHWNDLIVKSQHVYRKVMKGKYKNMDVFI